MKRWGIIVGVTLVVVAIGTFVAFRFAVNLLKDKIAVALGPGGELREIKVGWNSIELAGLSIQAPKDWPAAKTLEAERVTIVPSLRSLFTDQIKIASITIEKPYISALRTPGKLAIVPSLIKPGEKEKRRESQAAARTVAISRLELKDGVMEVYDATVGRPPVRIRLEAIHAVVRDVVAPALKEKSEFEIDAIVKGAKRDGQVKISGWLAELGRDSSSQFILSGVDLVSLQPYLVKKGDVRVEKGSVDLNLKSEVRNNQLDGKGKLVIRELQLADSGGFMGTFMGMPRNAVVNSLKDKKGVIDIDFALKGDVTHPNFSLNEALSTRIAAGVAGQLGVSIKGLAEGVGTLGGKSAEGVGKAAGGIGSAVRDLFGGGEKK
jgi:uncharacterized protein involved in outer membrane biogenesis